MSTIHASHPTSRLKVREGFLFLRCCLVAASLWPIFLVWAVRGDGLPSQEIRWWLVGVFGVVPAIALLWRYRRVKARSKNGQSLGNEMDRFIVRRLTDRREHLLSYLFPTLLSLWAIDIETCRDLAAFSLVLAFTALAFWHLQLTYVNFFFALLGFRSVQVEAETGKKTPLRPIIVLTRDNRLNEGDAIDAYKLTESLFIQKHD